MNDPRSRLIVALDLPGRSEALLAVDRLSGHVGFFKVGLEIFVSQGPSLVEEIANRGERVFLDLKLHDIPNTVAGAVRSAARLGAQMLTVHAAGGTAMLEAALEAANSVKDPPMLIAVTALTSLSEEDARRVGIGETLPSWVQRLASVGYDAGIRGFVASAREVALLRARHGGEVVLVVPGIRPTGAEALDQSRTSTPQQAIRSGADYLVVGRPILRSADPAAAADEIVRQIAGALKSSAQKKP